MSTLIKNAFICNATPLSSGVYGKSNGAIFVVKKGYVGPPQVGEDTDANLTPEELEHYGRKGIYATEEGELDLKEPNWVETKTAEAFTR
jgi:hypothetical protein